MRPVVPVSLVLLVVSGCAAPQPVLYPNDRLRAAGEAQARRDVEECRALAESGGAAPGSGGAEAARSTAVGAGVGAAGGAVGGAIAGSVGTGAAVGAASGATVGLLRGLFGGPEPSATHRRFVERCLQERGYEPIGWE